MPKVFSFRLVIDVATATVTLMTMKEPNVIYILFLIISICLNFDDGLLYCINAYADHPDYYYSHY